jgi:hypothetical protein
VQIAPREQTPPERGAAVLQTGRAIITVTLTLLPTFIAWHERSDIARFIVGTVNFSER